MSVTTSPPNEDLISLLYVDDEQDLLTLAKLFLERTGNFRVDILNSAQTALISSNIHSYDAIVSDYQMPGMDGITFLKIIRENYGDIPFILFTGRGREEIVIEAVNSGVDFYLQKGGDPKPQFVELSHKIKQAVRRKHAEKFASDSETNQFKFIHSLSDATFAITNYGQVIAWNHAMEEITGVTSGEMIGKNNYEYAIPIYGTRRPLLIDLIDETRERILQFYPDYYRAGNSLFAETTISTQNKSKITVQIMTYHLYNVNGDIIGTVESVRDITEIHETKIKLIESEIKFRNLVNYSQDSIFIIGFDGTILYINPMGLCMIEEEDDETIIGKKNVLQYIHPLFHDELLKDIHQVNRGTEGYIVRYKLITAKNREIWIESIGSKIPYQDSEAILISSRNITRRKEAEETLIEREEHFRAISEQSEDIIVRVGRDFKILYCNPKIFEYTGIPADQLIGTDSRLFQGYDDTITSWIRKVNQVFENGIPARDEWRLKSGKWFDFLLYPEYGKDNTIIAVTTSIRDISWVIRNEEEMEIFYKNLLLQRELTAALINAIPIPVFWKGINRHYLECNPALTNLLGVTPGELIGKTADQIWTLDKDIKALTDQDNELISKGFLNPVHTKLTDYIGKKHDVIISKDIFRDHEGNIAGIVGSIQDISDQVRLNRELKKREELFRMIVTQSLDIFAIISPQMEITYISPKVEDLTGYLTEEVLGPVNKFIHPDDYARVVEKIENIAHYPSFSDIAEFRTLKRDGTYILLDAIAVNCIDNPAIQGILVSARDITRRRETEIQLSRINQIFKTVLNASPLFFILFNKEGEVIFANKTFLDQVGVNDFSENIFTYHEVFPIEYDDICCSILAEVHKTKVSFGYEFQFPGKEEPIRLSSIFFPIQEGDELRIGFVGLDITEKQDLLLKLDASISENEILERMVKERTEEVLNLLDLKNSLITAVAHELRTPLTPITVLLPFLIDEDERDQREEIISIIKNNTEKITTIVTKILELANLGAIYSIENISIVRVPEVVENILSVYSIGADRKNIAIVTDINPDLTLRTSLPHLVSVLDNIISNAIKFSNHGGRILITAEEKSDDIILTVRDSGIGINQNEIERIFEPFYKADKSRHDRSSPGLGLSVTRRMIQLIGGKISIFSDGPGTGTEVHLQFSKAGP